MATVSLKEKLYRYLYSGDGAADIPTRALADQRVLQEQAGVGPGQFSYAAAYTESLRELARAQAQSRGEMQVLLDKARYETQQRGIKAFLAYYEDSPYAMAKLGAGMVFTPELIDYLEREVENRRIAADIKTENTKDIPDVTDIAPSSDADGEPVGDDAGDDSSGRGVPAPGS